MGFQKNGSGENQTPAAHFFCYRAAGNQTPVVSYAVKISDNRFFGTSSATPWGQSANFAEQFTENYVASGAGGVLIDPVA